MSVSVSTDNRTCNVICIKWGDRYGPEYVNRLYSMVKRNTSFTINFYCFTENPQGLNGQIKVKDLPTLLVAPEDNKYAYRKEAGLCDDQLGGLNGQRVLFFDLDVVIVDNIDSLFTFPSGNDFVIIRDWHAKDKRVGQASCYSWVVGTLGHVKKYFEDHPKEVVMRFRTASQAYLSDQVLKKYGTLVFWPEPWCRSFRFHCLPAGFLRRFVVPKIPAGAKLIIFHGSPKPHEALAGVWSYDKPIPLYKRWYKIVLPTRWISDYWR